MYVITAIVVICVVLLFLRGLYLSYLDSLKEDMPLPRQLTNEEKLHAAYRNAYFAHSNSRISPKSEYQSNISRYRKINNLKCN